ncbi:hypothetical protein AB0M95_27805 [Sphaerisporangium sp. NPDC051017]|uniref:hypothetical protein n=1 Tax=Sphaerisporangium sp. NPDC051017 TaxID=3154636 RepID=UPI003448A86B
MIRVVAAVLAVLTVLCATACTAGPQRPAPGTTPVHRQPPEQPFGLKWDGYQHPPTPHDAVIEAYGGGGTFHEIVWCAVEPRRGERNWWLDDRVVSDLLAYGYRVMLRIRVGSCWASGRPGAERPRVAVSYPPADTAAYEAFVRDTVTRYAAKGVHLYGIENEIDAFTSWGVDPREYQAVGRAGARAVRAADPAAKVLDAGVASAGYGITVAKALLDAGQPDRALTFYRDFYAGRGDGNFPLANSADELRAAFALPRAQRAITAQDAVFELDREGVFDIVQLHYYAGWSAVPDVIDHIRAKVPASMPIEAWELGTYWPGSDYDPALHGTETAKVVALLLARGVKRIVYLPLNYKTKGALVSSEHWRGLYGADNVARPAKLVYDKFREHFATGTWHPVARQGLSGGLADQGATTTMVLWSTSGAPVAQPLPAVDPSRPIAVTALPSGRSWSWTSGTLEVGKEPLIVTFPAPYTDALRWLEAA